MSHCFFGITPALLFFSLSFVFIREEEHVPLAYCTVSIEISLTNTRSHSGVFQPASS